MNKQALTVSIIIPVYNEESHLKNCLDSIALQSIQPDEVIVIDNNSTDKSIEVAKSYPFVTVLKEPKQGVIFARNRGFSAAKSDIIGRIDAETVIPPTWVERVIEVFKDPDIAATTGPMFYYDMPFIEDNYLAEHIFKQALHKYDKRFPFLAGNNMAMRRRVWGNIRPKLCVEQSIHEDMDLAIHLKVDHYVVHYDPLLRAGSSSRRFDDNPRDFKRYITMMTRTFSHHNMKPVGAHVAVAGYSLGYVVLWPLRRAYNHQTGKREVKQLVRGHNARKNPMD